MRNITLDWKLNVEHDESVALYALCKILLPFMCHGAVAPAVRNLLRFDVSFCSTGIENSYA